MQHMRMEEQMELNNTPCKLQALKVKQAKQNKKLTTWPSGDKVAPILASS
jgi:hypothetical protein